MGFRKEFVDYTTLLEKHINFAEVKKPIAEPWLLIGAINILSGDFKAFDSKKAEITVDAVRASGAIPGFGVRAVKIGDGIFWDGVYSQNPPVQNFVADPEQAADKPDEIWVIQINPKEREEEPKSVEDIFDYITLATGAGRQSYLFTSTILWPVAPIAPGQVEQNFAG